MSAGETVLVEECNTERAPGRRAALRSVPMGADVVVLRGRTFRRTSRALKDGTPVFAPEERVPDDHE